MECLKKWFTFKTGGSAWPGDPDFNPSQFLLAISILSLWLVVTVLLFYCAFHSISSFAAGGASLPGEDASGKLEAAGILLKTLDTGLFKWGARIFAGICIMSSAWALKEQRFGIAIICVIGAIIFGTAPKWVKNIFEIGDNQSIFSQGETIPCVIAASGRDTARGMNAHV